MKLRKIIWGLFTLVLTAAVAVTSVMVMKDPLLELICGTGSVTMEHHDTSMNAELVDRYNMYINNRLSSALDGVLAIDKQYWLSDDDLVAPEPDPEAFGTYNSPSEMGAFLEAAKPLLNGQETFFNTQVNTHPRTKVLTYLDETIMTITWKEPIDGIMYTFSEVKIAHPSQFRRFLTGGTYGSEQRMVTTDMAANVNAVVASSGDFYAHRQWGICVYDGKAYRGNSYLDTCFIDDKGDLIFKRSGTLRGVDNVQKFVDENNIRFSLAFGPILIEDGKAVKTEAYLVGENDKEHVRAALCQLGELHYLMIAANHDDRLAVWMLPENLEKFQKHLLAKGIQNAYCLDGGQTAVIVHNDKMINAVEFGTQRQISDIIYFATAMP